jgi:SAM-dependent methyltransferase
MSYRTLSGCRGCGTSHLISVLDMGTQPLANGLRRAGDPTIETRYPLHLERCASCELVQLSVAVDPDILYGNHYPYRSGVNDGWAFHCHELAKEMGKGSEYGPINPQNRQEGPRKAVLDIGCLDGVLLRECRDRGWTVQGIDPSAPEADLPIRRERFMRNTQIGQYDVIVAQNVFGHVDDAEGFLVGIQRALQSDGYAVIECPWVVDLIDGVRWDTIYHEHLSYWGLRPLARLCQKVGLQVTATRAFPDLHGGTMRYTLAHDGPVFHPQVANTWDDEEMDDWSWQRVRDVFHEQVSNWNGVLQGTARTAAFGASAKLNTFLNALPDRPRLEAVFDDTPAKQGMVTPGWGFPILAPTEATLQDLDVLLIGSANWRTALEQRARSLGFRGEVVSLWATH